MSVVQFHWQDYKYFPYERELARREVKVLLGTEPSDSESHLEVPMDGHPEALYRRLTYFKEVVLPSGQRIFPDQARFEASRHAIDERGKNLFGSVHARRQSTRYSAHGLHDYRGKFNPQVVRAIGNMLGLPIGSSILDPFCGSGTTLLESAHVGWNAVGLDSNPLAVLISNAKLLAFQAPAGELSRESNAIARRLLEKCNGLDYERPWSESRMTRMLGCGWPSRLPNFTYLSAWFTRSVLAQLVLILEEIRQSRLARVFEVVLSDLARGVSLQDPADLRCRRRKDPSDNSALIPTFVDSMTAKIELIIKAKELAKPPPSNQLALVADSRDPLQVRHAVQAAPRTSSGGFDAVITSPPYVTALPYIDTQRLSLALLGLASPRGMRQMEEGTVGSREISDLRRRQLEAALTEDQSDLPHSVIDFCRHMLDLAMQPDNGFRRRNMPALTYTYFQNMSRVFRGVHRVMRIGSVFALVVGRNKTSPSGQEIVIDTPRLLADVAINCGWNQVTELELDTYQRFDIHRRNSILTESLIVLERK